ncbi:hypothetical protein ADEAN_000779000 [Angomonas deanei]|uniref:Uncharacterized protein n=1 Tax=Angomonas deanei TaxID=59799 RepID=A0A7G2CLH3_9TRYP|nr:hypothetical protein ADEAN_000779000 [Angomonas deanei]
MISRSVSDFLAHKRVLDRLKTGEVATVVNEIGLEYQFICKATPSDGQWQMMLCDERDEREFLTVERVVELGWSGSTMVMVVTVDGDEAPVRLLFSPNTQMATREQWDEVLRTVLNVGTRERRRNNDFTTITPVTHKQMPITPRTVRAPFEKPTELLSKTPVVSRRDAEEVPHPPSYQEDQLATIYENLEKRLEHLKGLKEWLLQSDTSTRQLHEFCEAAERDSPP